jgi:hypothetical protein
MRVLLRACVLCKWPVAWCAFLLRERCSCSVFFGSCLMLGNRCPWARGGGRRRKLDLAFRREECGSRSPPCVVLCSFLLGWRTKGAVHFL